MAPGGLPGGQPYSTPGGGTFTGGPGSLFLLIKEYSIAIKIIARDTKYT
jgi:hypothetical protein